MRISFSAKKPLIITPPPSEKTPEKTASLALPKTRKGRLLAVTLATLMGGAAGYLAQPPNSSNPHNPVAAVSQPANTSVHTDVYVTAGSREAALFSAASNGDAQTAQALIKQGVNINARSGTGATALHIAVQNFMGSGVAEVLLNNHADPNMRDDRGRTPMHLAAGSGREDAMKLLLRHKANLNITDNNGDIAMHALTISHNQELGWLLLRTGGFSVNAKNHYGQTPLHQASDIQNTPMIELLVGNGADPNARDIYKNTPLHRIAATPDEEGARWLVAHGADAKLKNENGQSALDVAKLMGHKPMITYLSGLGKKVL